MSAKGKGKATPPREADNYPTPAWVARQFFQDVLQPVNNPINTIHEPCRGVTRWPIYDAACNWHAGYANVTYHEISEGKDYLSGKLEQVDLVVTNPPFTLFERFLDRAIVQARMMVAFLLRVNALGGQERQETFWSKQVAPPDYLRVLSTRPSFVDVCQGCKHKYGPDDRRSKSGHMLCRLCGGKLRSTADATEYAWMIWVRPGNDARHLLTGARRRIDVLEPNRGQYE